MPFTIREINQFVPRANRNVVNEDPTSNTVLGNMQLLLRALEPVKSKSPHVDYLKRSLKAVLDACNLEATEAVGNSNIELLRDRFYYVAAAMKKQADSKEEQEKQTSVLNLIGHVAAGLELKPLPGKNFEITDEQREAAQEMREEGRKAVEAEGPGMQEEAERLNVTFKAYQALETQKTEVSSMPKRIADPSREQDLKQELAEHCTKIFALRRAAGAERNQKSQLKKKEVTGTSLNKWQLKLGECQTLKNFLLQMPYEKLRALAAEGHGGAMEEAFQKYVRNLDRLPQDLPSEYRPTAKQRTEALQEMIRSDRFRSRPPQEQRALYVELLATRAAVESKRKDAGSLDNLFSTERLNEEQERFQKDPLKTVLDRVIARNGGADAREAATTGHGGLLEDKLRDEFREMGKSSQYNYSMPGYLPERYQPTYAQRMKDIQTLLGSNRLNDQEKLLRLQEFARLANAEVNSLDTVIAPRTMVKHEAEQQAKYLPRVESKPVISNLQRACLKGKDAFNATLKAVNQRYAGDLYAAKVMTELAEHAKKTEDKAELMELAAKKMLVSKDIFNHKMEFNKAMKQGFIPNDDQSKLQHNVDKSLADRKALDGLKASKAFQAMCSKMSAEELRQQIQGGTYDLTQKVNEAEDELENPDREIQRQPKVQSKDPKAEEFLLPLGS